MLIKAAAVADFKPRLPSGQKIKRKGPMTIEFDPTPDILAEVAQRRTRSADRHRLRRRDRRRPRACAGEAQRQGTRRDRGQRRLPPRHRLRFRSQRGHDPYPKRAPPRSPKASKRAVADAVLDCALRLRLKIARMTASATDDSGARCGRHWRRACAFTASWASPISTSAPWFRRQKPCPSLLLPYRPIKPVRSRRCAPTSAIACAAVCRRRARTSSSPTAIPTRRSCSSARGRARTRTSRGFPSLAARGSCSTT